MYEREIAFMERVYHHSLARDYFLFSSIGKSFGYVYVVSTKINKEIRERCPLVCKRSEINSFYFELVVVLFLQYI